MMTDAGPTVRALTRSRRRCSTSPVSEGRTMPIAPLLLAVGIIVASGLDAMAVEMTRPFETLEAARRDRVELDKRMKREAAEQKRREREAKAQQDAPAATTTAPP